MKLLFVLLTLPDNIKSGGMYMDLIDEFKRKGHNITIIASKNSRSQPEFENVDGIKTARVDSLPTQNVKNMIKKGFALASLPWYFKKIYKKYFKLESFDWVFMPTPPITLSSLIKYIKLHSGAKFYLILRDIHPQSTWSIGLIKYKWMYNYLDRKARLCYSISDIIGCMSYGNIRFIESLYPSQKIGELKLLYNWQKEIALHRNNEIREKYSLSGKIVVLFGGTIGKAQRIENLVNLAIHYKENKNLTFVVIGKGVAKDKLNDYIIQESLDNVIIFDFMPRNDYLDFVSSVDIGLISINENYKVPTCPSKAVSYMALGIPIFAMINPNNDYGNIIEDEAKAGFYTVGGEQISFEKFDKLISDSALRKKLSDNGFEFYKRHLTSEVAYNTIINQIEEINGEKVK